MTAYYSLVAGLGFIGLSITFWLLLTLRRDGIFPHHVHADVPDLLRMGRRDEALLACRRSRSALGAVWAAALSYCQRMPHPRRSSLYDVMDGERRRQFTLVQARASYLLDVGSSALLFGLFLAGCALAGLLAPSSFDVLRASPDALSEALCAAAASSGMGLAVSVIAIAAYTLFRGFGAPALDELAGASRDMLALLVPEEPITNNQEPISS